MNFTQNKRVSFCIDRHLGPRWEYAYLELEVFEFKNGTTFSVDDRSFEQSPFYSVVIQGIVSAAIEFNVDISRSRFHFSNVKVHEIDSGPSVFLRCTFDCVKQLLPQ
jgi:hypothetical protein